MAGCGTDVGHSCREDVFQFDVGRLVGAAIRQGDRIDDGVADPRRRVIDGFGDSQIGSADIDVGRGCVVVRVGVGLRGADRCRVGDDQVAVIVENLGDDVEGDAGAVGQVIDGPDTGEVVVDALAWRVTLITDFRWQ